MHDLTITSFLLDGDDIFNICRRPVLSTKQQQHKDFLDEVTFVKSFVSLVEAAHKKCKTIKVTGAPDCVLFRQIVKKIEDALCLTLCENEQKSAWSRAIQISLVLALHSQFDVLELVDRAISATCDGGMLRADRRRIQELHHFLSSQPVQTLVLAQCVVWLVETAASGL